MGMLFRIRGLETGPPLWSALAAGICAFVGLTGLAVLLMVSALIGHGPVELPTRARGHLILDGESALRCPETLDDFDAFTVECWVLGGMPDGPQAIVGNSHYSGYALYWVHPGLDLWNPSAWVKNSRRSTTTKRSRPVWIRRRRRR